MKLVHWFSPRETNFVRGTCCVFVTVRGACSVLIFVRENCFLFIFSLRKTCSLTFLRMQLFLFMELVTCWFCSWNCCVLIFVQKTFCMLIFFSWYLDTDFLIIKLILFKEHIACWFLFVELVAYWFLLVKLVPYWFFSLWNSHTDFSPRKNDFVLGTCYVLILLFVCGTWCMLIFYCDTCWFFRENCPLICLHVKLILFMRLVA